MGLFFDRNAREVEPFKVDVAWRAAHNTSSAYGNSFRSFLCFIECSTDKVISQAPLNRRAWVMQERHLSRRIVHYTKQQVFWECHETLVSELPPFQLPSEHVLDPERTIRGLKLLLASYDRVSESCPSSCVPPEQKSLYRAWCTFIQWYSACALTFPRDKAVALTGVAQDVSQILRDELVAGLWRSRFISQLC